MVPLDISPGVKATLPFLAPLDSGFRRNDGSFALISSGER